MEKPGTQAQYCTVGHVLVLTTFWAPEEGWLTSRYFRKSRLNSFVYSGIPFEIDRTAASYRRGSALGLVRRPSRPTFIGRETCNEIPGLYDKISITTVPSYTGK